MTITESDYEDALQTIENIERVIGHTSALFTQDIANMGLTAKEYRDWCEQHRENTTEAFYRIIHQAKRTIQTYERHNTQAMKRELKDYQSIERRE